MRTLPRPSGRATRVIVTEYDMTRPTTEPHDVLLDKDGIVWYSDFGEPFISKFDPKTLKLTEYPIKEFNPGPRRQSQPRTRYGGHILVRHHVSGRHRHHRPEDRRDRVLSTGPDWNDFRVQINFVGLRHDVDGKVWTKNVATVDLFRLDLDTGKWERFHPIDFLPPGQRYTIYQLISDSQNNVWMAEFEDGYLGKLDAKTLKVTWFPLPSPMARATHGDRRSGPNPGHRIPGQQARTVQHEDGAIYRI